MLPIYGCGDIKDWHRQDTATYRQRVSTRAVLEFLCSPSMCNDFSIPMILSFLWGCITVRMYACHDTPVVGFDVLARVEYCTTPQAYPDGPQHSSAIRQYF